MKQFQRHADGLLLAELNADEAALLQTLAGQVAEVVATGVPFDSTGFGDPTAIALPRASDDPVLARLLPDAHPGDAEASAEFRRYTESGLARRKLANADTIVRSLDGAGLTGTVALDEAEALAWLRSLTDIRLTIAVRLGIDSEEHDDGRDIDPLMREIYDWLGFVQNSLVEALDAPHV